MAEFLPTEYVYRRRDLSCALCGAAASIELRVGAGGNYRTIYVCAGHNRQPDQYLETGETRLSND